MSHFSTVLHANRLERATGVGKAADVVPGSALVVQLDVTERADATSSLDVVIQDSLDNGKTWNDIVTFTQVTAATSKEIKSYTSRVFGRKLRAKWTIAGDEAVVAAALTTDLTGSDNDLKYTAKTAGLAGNSISVTYVDPSANDAALEVSVVGKDITVSLATSEAGAITSTAAQIAAAIEATPAANALVTVEDAPANNGTGVVTALTKTNLSSGADAEDSAWQFTVHAVTR